MRSDRPPIALDCEDAEGVAPPGLVWPGLVWLPSAAVAWHWAVHGTGPCMAPGRTAPPGLAWLPSAALRACRMAVGRTLHAARRIGVRFRVARRRNRPLDWISLPFARRSVVACRQPGVGPCLSAVARSAARTW